MFSKATKIFLLLTAVLVIVLLFIQSFQENNIYHLTIDNHSEYTAEIKLYGGALQQSEQRFVKNDESGQLIVRLNKSGALRCEIIQARVKVDQQITQNVSSAKLPKRLLIENNNKFYFE